MAKNILIINGPNLNLLGRREPEIYGSLTLGDIEDLCKEKAKQLSLNIDFRQSNGEGEIIDWIQEADSKFDALIINPAAYSHSSIAIFDALLSIKINIIEVHLSNIYKREKFRHHSYVSRAASGIICGLGAKGYLLALEALAKQDWN